MTGTPILPYFDFILAMLAQANPAIERSFGRHVHFGFWEDPAAATFDDHDFAGAAERLTVEVCKAAEIASGESVLDVGCGFGGTLASLNERHVDMRLVGLNLEARQLVRAREIVKAAPSNTLEWHQGDACLLPFADASFDRVLAVECIFHFSSREAFLREAFRVLRPGGTVAFSDFVPSSLFLPVARLATEARVLARFQYFGRCNLGFTARAYRRLTATLGFQPLVQRNVTANILPTYPHLKALLVGPAAIEGITGPIAHFVDVLRGASSLGLLNYYVMAFRKPLGP